MANTGDLLKEAQSIASASPQRAEVIYKEILGANAPSSTGSPEVHEQAVRNQEIALVKLGELYRDQKYASGFVSGPHRLTGSY